MPPKAVRTIRDLIYWQYAKIISESAGFGKKQFAFVMERFKKLQSSEIECSTSTKEQYIAWSNSTHTDCNDAYPSTSLWVFPE